MAKVDIDNFMGVIQATQQTEDGLRFPGEHMLSGKPVTAAGVTLAEVMSDRGMAEQWHAAIKETYEREKDERDNPRSNADTPDLVIRGQDGDADDGQGGASPAPVHPAEAKAELPEATSLEEILAARFEKWDARVQELEPMLEEARTERSKARKALDAISGV